MAKEKEVVVDEPRQSQYNEEAFDKLVESDADSSSDDESGLSDFPEFDDDLKGAKEDDGDSDIKSKEQPEGEQESDEDKGSDTDKDDPKQSKEDSPELPAWMESISEDQKDDAVTDLLKLHQEIEKLEARYESQSGQLKPTQRRLARMEELLKISTLPKPGDDLEESAAKLDAWIEKHGKDFPDEAEALKASFDAYKKSVSTIEDDAKKYRSTLERNDDDTVDRTLQLRNLQRMDAGIAEINADPAFAKYLEQHPEHQAQVKSPYAHDVIQVVDNFRKDTEWQPPMQSDDFLNVDQMLASPIFEVWSRAIGLTAKQVVSADEAGQSKVFHQFKVELDQAHQLDDEGDEGSDNDESNEAIELAKRRDKRKKDHSPKARGTGTGGGKPAALHGKEYFDLLEV